MIKTIKLSELSVAERHSLTRRSPVSDPAVRQGARRIVESIRDGGDDALRAASERHGGGLADGSFAIDPAEFSRAADRIDPDLLAGLDAAHAAITDVHQSQRPSPTMVSPVAGVDVERRWAPLRRVGVYAPGGLAAYPSSVLMAAAPAAIAGVDEIVVASPAGPNGSVSDVVLAACAVAGVTEFYAMGGAQAVAALAYGTESIRPVDKVVGPGNAWVTAAKLEVFGVCGIDLPAGPSEALEIVDASADPTIVAADLISQAEHGPDSVAVLVAVGDSVADLVLAEIEPLLDRLDRSDIIRSALAENALIAVAGDLEEACAFANEFAPEHLGIHTANPEDVIAAVPAAGSVFAGHFAPHSAGDYATGANHVLPTGGLARAYGPLSVEDFGSFRQIQRITRDGLAALRPTVASIARGEGLSAHRLAVDIRFEDPT
ncbi:MAG: histidinol dehydrogenase [Acidimicrobiia bacterium]|nr:histidinol dehydrogenase [Acidimicrobiia bacterium]